jgi:hypothetical protein
MSEIIHSQIVTYPMNVIVGRMIEKMHGSGKGQGIFSPKGFLPAAGEDQFDEAFVLGADQAIIEGKGPYNCIGGGDLVHDAAEGPFIPLQFSDLSGDGKDPIVMLRMDLLQIAYILEGNT